MSEVGLGIDACRADHRASLADERGEFIWSSWKFRTTTTDLERLWAKIPEGASVTVILEPTRNAWVPLSAWLQARGATVILVPPEQSSEFIEPSLAPTGGDAGDEDGGDGTEGRVVVFAFDHDESVVALRECRVDVPGVIGGHVERLAQAGVSGLGDALVPRHQSELVDLGHEPGEGAHPGQVGEATLSLLVGAITIARAVDDPELSDQILTGAATALKERIPTNGSDRRPATKPAAKRTRPS